MEFPSWKPVVLDFRKEEWQSLDQTMRVKSNQRLVNRWNNRVECDDCYCKIES